jgi:hypothetical protein
MRKLKALKRSSTPRSDGQSTSGAGSKKEKGQEMRVRAKSANEATRRRKWLGLKSKEKKMSPPSIFVEVIE